MKKSSEIGKIGCGTNRTRTPIAEITIRGSRLFAVIVIGFAALLWLSGCKGESNTGFGDLTDSGTSAGSGGAKGGDSSVGTGGTATSGSGGEGGVPSETGGEPSSGSGGSGSDDAALPSDSCPPNMALPAICRLCSDGSCGKPVCSDGAFTGKWICPEDEPPTVDCDCVRGAYVPVCGIDGETHDATCGRECVDVKIACSGPCPCTDCVVGGCSGQLCVEAGNDVVSTCEWLEQYACYASAICERQVDGNCGWTRTLELTQCLEEAGGDAMLYWYQTCGDPVCGVSPDPFDDPNIRNCLKEKIGDPCTTEGDRCDGVADCGASLICAASDPTMGPGGCPISRARFKEDIAYLSDRELIEYRDQLLRIPLASYRYRQAPGAGPQLGFIIEDIEPSVAVSGDRVNLYGYLSMAVAAIKTQQSQIESLQRELDQLRSQPAPQSDELVCLPVY